MFISFFYSNYLSSLQLQTNLLLCPLTFLARFHILFTFLLNFSYYAYKHFLYSILNHFYSLYNKYLTWGTFNYLHIIHFFRFSRLVLECFSLLLLIFLYTHYLFFFFFLLATCPRCSSRHTFFLYI